ncbi:MAG TPA: hypothetical protein VNV18_00685 [Stellaceae bacterium]|jgi:hypothetical protein|nr:hypothetical protein [Stellaceae bacterium]
MNREIQAGNMTLAELVQDSLVALVMKSDGVDPHCIEALFKRISMATAARGSTADRCLRPQV